MWTILADPAMLAILLPATGAAGAWIWTQIAKARSARKNETDELRRLLSECQMQRALLEQQLAEARGSIATLTRLLKRETHVG